MALKNWHASGIKVSVWSNSCELRSADYSGTRKLFFYIQTSVKKLLRWETMSIAKMCKIICRVKNICAFPLHNQLLQLHQPFACFIVLIQYLEGMLLLGNMI